MAIWLWPYPVQLGWEIVALVLHYVGHQASINLPAGRHHLLHHRRPDCNFGLHPESDLLYGTYREEKVTDEKTSGLWATDFYKG